MPTPATPAQGASIVSYLQTRLGQRIDRGECWDAAERAIQSIGSARPGSDLYVWGSVVQQANLQPGDILQFSNFTVRVTQSDGSWAENSFGAPRHTAIVSSVNADGSVNLLHQNYGGARNVTALPNVFLAGSSAGGVTVAVSGTVTRYRAQLP